MLDFSWRNIALFVVALAIASCLMTWGVILAIDRLLYVNWDRETGTPNVEPVRIERTHDLARE